jgi:radical SAM-linked protein
MTRYPWRILFAKTEAMRYTGHLDLQRAWERLLRRAEVPVAYSEGFHPRPKIRIGAALPLGVTGENELVDMETDEPCEARHLAGRVNDKAPPGIRVADITALAEGSPTLAKLITAGEYSAEPLEGAWPEDLPERIERLIESETLPRERRGRKYDLRPRILSLSLESGTLRMRLSLLPEATGRPDEVLAELGLNEMPADVRREKLILREADDKE